MKVVKLFVIIFSIFVILLGGGLYFFLHKQKPHYKGTLYIDGLDQACDIYYDSYGIPHIFANNESDAYFALGFSTAQERLFQMEMMRRVSSGRLSEIFGSSTVDIDRFFRMLGLNRLSKKEAERNFTSESLSWVKAATSYINGINHFIENENLPVEFTLLGFRPEKYAAEDMYLIASYMSFSFAMGFKTDPLMQRIAQNLGPQYVDDLLLVNDTSKLCLPADCQHSKRIGISLHDRLAKLGVPLLSGSNAWIVSKEKSSNHAVLFANDPHIEFSQPAVWYEAHLSYPGKEFTGHFLAGLCFAPLGNTDHHTWGITMLLNDDVDFFFERQVENDSNAVWRGSNEESLQKYSETIHVKDSTSFVFEVRESSLGPVCSDAMDEIRQMYDAPVSLSWTYLKKPNSLLQVMYGFMNAKNMDEFKGYTQMIASPGLNIMYADQRNIAWFSAAHFINRKDSVHPSLFRNGSIVSTEDSYYQPQQNPCSVNPEIGFVYSANNQPESNDGVTHSGYYLNDDRAIRINQVLSRTEKLSIEDMKALQLDDTSWVMYRINNLLLQSITEVDDSQRNATELMNLLQKWKGTYATDEIAPIVYNQFLYEVLELMMYDELGENDFKAMLKTHILKTSMEQLFENDSSVWWDNILTTNHIESKKELINEAYYKAIKKLNTIYGKNYTDWKWEKVHQLEHVHLIGKQEPLNKIFNVGPVGVAGGNETINNMGYEMNEKGIAPVRFGPSMRKIVCFSNPLKGWNVIPTGQSGNFMSRHYSDQAVLYNKGNYREMLMDHEVIQKEYRSKVQLKPKR